MTSSTLLSRGALAAILATGCLVAPAAMAQTPERGSGGKDPARANVYVPPSAVTATQQDMRSPDARDSASATSAHANVYVPPSPDTATRQGERSLETQGTRRDFRSPDARDAARNAGETANVYVPPAQGLPAASPSPAPTQTVAHPAVPSADDGVGLWAVVGLALGCAALLGGAGLALAHRRARRTVA
jgi:hypothetical protein